nr:hypothetical protein [Tanacetum cinerariifolium]
ESDNDADMDNGSAETYVTSSVSKSSSSKRILEKEDWYLVR